MNPKQRTRPRSSRSPSPLRAVGRLPSRPQRELAAGVGCYAELTTLDGRHPLRERVPGAAVSYPAKRRHDGEIAFFNFGLAREIGLLPADHPDEMTPGLRRTLLDTFAVVIVNEWDQAHGNLPPARDRLPHEFMATRYLQLQHPDKRGLNSGDGRSIWNGLVETSVGRFDVSSCGTGVTRLCPATSIHGEFFRTGNQMADYGCGTAHIEEGLGAALMSEAFARNGIRTERVLAIVALPGGFAINVRIAANLLRPSHFFGLLRRREDADLRECVLYYAEREIADRRWPFIASERERIRYLPERVAIDFARATATFESEYIFCWLDWDGDNVLTDGSIIDYGSVRQFGLYHHGYRFEDPDRMSTSIPEQKRKARQIVQRFAQIRDLLLRGSAPSLASLRDDPVLALFDREFERERRRLFLDQIGFEESEAHHLIHHAPACVDQLLSLHNRFERKRSSRGRRKVADGLSWDAVYCMRDVLRELPARLAPAAVGVKPEIPAETFYEIALSNYASRRDRRMSPTRRQQARAYQRAYLAVCERVAQRRHVPLTDVLADLAPRARLRNPYARMTGDGLTHAAKRLATSRRRLAPEETYRLIEAFADSQDRREEARTHAAARTSIAAARKLVRRIHEDLEQLSLEYRESL
ncbi:MAG: hypothetical protein IPK00_15345 [Deltaproteobacteria bacterium]|nr:hypothetical protein [Deltaproteobacteria bacterium]